MRLASRPAARLEGSKKTFFFTSSLSFSSGGARGETSHFQPLVRKSSREKSRGESPEPTELAELRPVWFCNQGSTRKRIPSPPAPPAPTDRPCRAIERVRVAAVHSLKRRLLEAEQVRSSSCTPLQSGGAARNSSLVLASSRRTESRVGSEQNHSKKGGKKAYLGKCDAVKYHRFFFFQNVFPRFLFLQIMTLNPSTPPSPTSFCVFSPSFRRTIHRMRPHL